MKALDISWYVILCTVVVPYACLFLSMTIYNLWHGFWEMLVSFGIKKTDGT